MTLEEGTHTNGDAVDIIDNEGIGYAVQHYTSGKYFKDPKTAELWDAAEKSLVDLREYLAKETGREVDG